MALNKSFVAALLIGALFGASATLAYQGKAYDRLYIAHQKLQEKYDELKLQREQLTEQLNRRSTKPVIETIRVSADAPDGLSEIEAIQWVKQNLAFLIGKPLDTLQQFPELPYQLINNHSFTIDHQQYILRVKTVVIGSIVYVAVSVSKSTAS